MGNTTHFYGWLSSAAHLAQTVHGKLGGSILPAKYVYAKKSGAWVGVYSVLAGSGTSSLSANPSGASTSGTATTSGPGVGASGNIGSPSYAWAYLSGDGSITCSNAAIASPTFSRAFSGVANGTTSSTITGSWRCTITDTTTGATTTFDVSLSFSWTNTIPAYIAPTVSSFNNMSGTINLAGTHIVTNGDGGGAGNPNIVIANGLAPFFYSWTDIGGNSGPTQTMSAGATSATPTIIASCANGITSQATWRCTISDSNSNSCFCDVVVTLDNN